MANSNSSTPQFQSSNISTGSTASNAYLRFLRRAILLFLRSNRKLRRTITAKTRKDAVLFRKVTLRETLTGILLLIPATSSAMLTYYGISIPLTEQGGTVVAKGQALAFAITMATFSWLGWFYLFGLIYSMRKLRLTAGLVAGSVLIGTFSFIDAPFNMLALGGGSAVQLTLVDTAEYYEAQKHSVFKQSTQARKLLPAIKAQAVRFRTLEQNEISNGSRTGSKGQGKVSDGFGQIAGLLETLATELENGLAISSGLQKQITAEFSELKSETYVTGPLRPRVNKVAVTADKIDDLLSQLEQQDFATSIEAILASLKAIFPAPSVANSAFENTQNAELSDIAAMAKPVAESLETSLQKITAIETPDLKRVRPQSALMAIRSKWNELFSQWLAAFFVNIAPAALLIILIAAFREAERRTDDFEQSQQK
jgi:hypothetical protein